MVNNKGFPLDFRETAGDKICHAAVTPAFSGKSCVLNVYFC
jgi:hypothetical protein